MSGMPTTTRAPSLEVQPVPQVSGARRPARRRRWVPIALVSPCVALIVALTIFPLLYSLGVSLFRWEIQVPGRPFVGLANYDELVHDASFWNSVGVTAIIAISAVSLELVFGMAL